MIIIILVGLCPLALIPVGLNVIWFSAPEEERQPAAWLFTQPYSW